MRLKEPFARCLYYFFIVVVIITYKTKATACRALTFILRVFVKDSIAVAVWTSFDTIRHSILEAQCYEKEAPAGYGTP
jgi:hypothetical protein